MIEEWAALKHLKITETTTSLCQAIQFNSSNYKFWNKPVSLKIMEIQQ